VIYQQYGDVVYDTVYLTGVSPDGGWLVFERSNRLTKKPDGTFRWQVDLFVIDLKSDKEKDR
jgi:hypothetical protein